MKKGMKNGIFSLKILFSELELGMSDVCIDWVLFHLHLTEAWSIDVLKIHRKDTPLGLVPYNL